MFKQPSKHSLVFIPGNFTMFQAASNQLSRVLHAGDSLSKSEVFPVI
jgi:hypothetical protein